MIKDQDVKNKIAEYLPLRYNLLTESAEDILEVLNRISEHPDYELVILDETIAGLATTSHTLNNIKDREFDTNVLYLSNLRELTPPYWEDQLELLPLCSDENFRLSRTTEHMKNRLAMHSPVMKATTMEEAYPIVCNQLVESFQVDGALTANLRLRTDPVINGIISGTNPADNIRREEFYIAPTGHLRELITYYHPIHIPDLNEEPEFVRDLEEKFQLRCRSILLLPMQLAGKSVGFIGMYMREKPRVFNLAEIDLSQRMADTATAILISIFFKKHINIKIDRV
ncbi:MAG: hypothetical protein GY950_07925, partial [bacterium]|nr:hypothetical protein [bacterium]